MATLLRPAGLPQTLNAPVHGELRARNHRPADCRRPRMHPGRDVTTTGRCRARRAQSVPQAKTPEESSRFSAAVARRSPKLRASRSGRGFGVRGDGPDLDNRGVELARDFPMVQGDQRRPETRESKVTEPSAGLRPQKARHTGQALCSAMPPPAREAPVIDDGRPSAAEGVPAGRQERRRWTPKTANRLSASSERLVGSGTAA